MKKIIICLLVCACLQYNCSKDYSAEFAFDYETYDLYQFEFTEIELPEHFDNYKPKSIGQNSQKAALGRLLFYDPKLSLNNSIACSGCHDQANSFAESSKFSNGLNNVKTTRNTMTLVNTGFDRSLFWDSNSTDLLQAVINPIRNHKEMGMESLSFLSRKLQKIDGYPKLFEKVFNRDSISEQAISEALGAFLSSLISFESKYDLGENSNFANFNVSEFEGMELFFGKAQCSQCHTPPLFNSSWSPGENIGLDLATNDTGYMDGRFKVVSLRNIELTSPYMHDGRFNTLLEVVNHYDHQIKNTEFLSLGLQDDYGKAQKLHLSEHEKFDLVEFLKTLTDWEYVSKEKFANPYKN